MERLGSAEVGTEEPRSLRPGALTALLREIAATPQPRGTAWESVLHPGSVIGRFELVAEIGRGGLGVVWEARDRELGRSVAFKAVRSGGHVAAREERLLLEAEAAARLSHPNIVTLFDVGRAEAGPFLIMELLRGETLADRLTRGALTVTESVRVVTEVTKGIAHAHAHAVVHRDLKPANVFLSDDGQVKVLDFGMAQAFGRPRVDGGTPAYMAPEQFAGAPEDERTDVFALGVMLFEMLSGRLPFDDEQALRSSTAAHALDVPERPALASLVGRMLEKDPVRRPRDGAELMAELEPLGRAREGQGSRPEKVRVRPRWRRATAVIAGAVVAVASVAALARWFIASQRAAPPAVAVLPFADLSQQRDQEYLADGVAEQIIDTLSRVDGLRVVGRNSSFHFKGADADLRTIGARLGVGSVLEGSVRRTGDRIRVSARLLDASDGFRIWSDTFDRDVKDVLAVQDEIAAAVASGLRVKLLAGNAPSGRAREPANADAYAEYLKGKHLARRGTEPLLRDAIQAFEKAVALDPTYAAAYAELSGARLNLRAFFAVGPDELVDRARADAERAIALAPALPDGYVSRAGIMGAYDHDWAGSLGSLERALSLSPGDLRARHGHALTLATMGRVPEAIAEMESILRDDPLAAGSLAFLGIYRAATGRLDLARDNLERALEIEPQHQRAIAFSAVVELLAGRPEEALAWSRRIQSEMLRRIVQAPVYHSLGREAEERAAIEWLERDGRAAYNLAGAHAWHGDLDAAFAALEEARVGRDPGLRAVKYDPWLRSIRGDPRYAEFLRKAKLPLD